MPCVHGRPSSLCKDCGGSGLCEHQRQKSQCKDCGGSGLCEHQRRKSRCKDCGGSGLCEHQRQKSRCKDCGGSGLCEHRRQKSRCKDCGGSEICEHNRIRSRCKDCGGSEICEHNRIRSRCKDCGGSGFCEHDRLKRQCKDCNPDYVRPVSKCKHHPLQPKQMCKFCPGPRICPLHFKFKTGKMCGDCRKKKPSVRRKFMHTVVDTRGSKPVVSRVIDEDKDIEEMQSKGASTEQVDKRRAFWRSMQGSGQCFIAT